MTCIAREPYEVPVPDDWEQLTGQDRYGLLRDFIMGKYQTRSTLPDRFKEGVRKQPRKV
jgi:hypothetical protein